MIHLRYLLVIIDKKSNPSLVYARGAAVLIFHHVALPLAELERIQPFRPISVQYPPLDPHPAISPACKLGNVICPCLTRM